MEEWLTDNKLPIGKAIDSAIRFIQDNAAWFFDIVTDGLEVVIEGLIDLLTFLPPLLLLALLAAGAGRVEFGTPHGLTAAEGLRLLGEQVLPKIRSGGDG